MKCRNRPNLKAKGGTHKHYVDQMEPEIKEDVLHGFHSYEV